MIPEYSVVNVEGQRVLMFRLVVGKYQEIETSVLVLGVTIALLEATINRWVESTNTTAASWFMVQILQ